MMSLTSYRPLITVGIATAGVMAAWFYFFKKRQRHCSDICGWSASVDGQKIVVLDATEDSNETLQKIVDDIQEFKVYIYCI